MNDRLTEKFVERFASAIVTVFIIAFYIVAIGAAALPAVMAYVLGWKWLAVYPVLLIAFPHGRAARSDDYRRGRHGRRPRCQKNEKGGVNDVLWTRRRFPCF